MVSTPCFPSIVTRHSLDMKPKNVVQQVMDLQRKMNAAQAELAKANYKATSAGGLVAVEVLGTGEIKRIDIDASLMSEEPAALGDIIATALNRAFTEKEEDAKTRLKAIGAGVLPMGLSIPGLG